jgi:hypothetical protein
MPIELLMIIAVGLLVAVLAEGDVHRTRKRNRRKTAVGR